MSSAGYAAGLAGLMAGEVDVLVESFAGEPELHHPVRGRIKGARALAAFVTEANAYDDSDPPLDP